MEINNIAETISQMIQHRFLGLRVFQVWKKSAAAQVRRF
jgi:hypothetical protein